MQIIVKQGFKSFISKSVHYLFLFYEVLNSNRNTGKTVRDTGKRKKPGTVPVLSGQSRVFLANLTTVAFIWSYQTLLVREGTGHYIVIVKKV